MSRDLTHYTPNTVWEFMSEVEKAFDDFWRTPQQASVATRREMQGFIPAVDIDEGNDFYLISVDIPGVSQKDVKIDVQNGRLSVSGERGREDAKEGKMFKRVERSYGRFERSFQLPQDVNEDKIQARYENGVVEIMLPKAEVSKPRAIQVDADKGGLFSRLLGQKNVDPNSMKTADEERQTSQMSEKH